MDQIVNELVGALLSAVAAGLIAVIVQVCRKYGLEISAARRAQMESIAQQGILVVEEKAHAAVKAQIGKLQPAQKFEGAVAHVLDKIPGISEKEAMDLVNSQLPKVRAATVDFTAAVLRSSTSQDGQ